jgi:hypothetical protein
VKNGKAPWQQGCRFKSAERVFAGTSSRESAVRHVSISSVALQSTTNVLGTPRRIAGLILAKGAATLDKYSLLHGENRSENVDVVTVMSVLNGAAKFGIRYGNSESTVVMLSIP